MSENPESVFRPRQREKPAPCQASCPNCGDIRGWIGVIAQRSKTGVGREDAYARAWRMITDVNPFPAVLGRICPHPCESGCNRSEKDDAVSINALERFLGDWAIAAKLPLEELEGDPKQESIGVIGAGPSGLSFAYQMARRGYPVTVYDEHEVAGGMLRHGIPDYRLPPQVLDGEIQRILDLGVALELNTRVGRDVTIAQLRERHDVLFLGVGAQKSLPLAIPGAQGPGAWTGVEYLARVNRGESVDLGRRVVVVGGGDTAVDAARTARRAGSDVTILYRRSQEEMPADAGEVEEALGEGIRIRFLTSPAEIKRQDGRVVGLVALRNELGAADGSGRRRPVPVAGSEHDVPTDAFIAAVSQEPDWRGLESFHGEGRWLVSNDVGRIDDGVWAGGDVLGLGIAGMAIFHGRRAAERVHADLRGPLSEAGARSEGMARSVAAIDGERDAADSGPPVPIGADRLRLDLYTSRPPAKPEHLPVEAALADAKAEVSLRLTEEQFLAEVERCLSCGKCFGCEHCFMYCTPLCFSRVEEAEPGSYFALALDRCEECGKCVEICPCGFLELI
jgi:NADPH-dependent glutamate synthase beta subunit-like oxidoreductase/Pyruvate/2-oxoacid:ferredoxin oxidoreductase delta subunit